MIRTGLTLAMAVLLIVANGSSVYSQRQSARRPQLNQRSGIYDRSYLQGYNEGFGQGQADWNRRAQRSDPSRQRNRSIEKDRDDLTDGYNLGLELGYSDGYYGRARNSIVPANASAMSNPASISAAERPGDRRSVSDSWDRYSNPKSYPPLRVPDDTEMRLRLTSPVNTKTNKVGDRFTAAITSPSRYVGARVEGHIASLNRSGRVTGKTELTLAFDTIILADGEQGPLSADLERILTSEQVKKVDEEGRIESGSRTVSGGTAGVGTVYVEGNNDLILETGTEMVIRTVKQRP